MPIPGWHKTFAEYQKAGGFMWLISIPRAIIKTGIMALVLNHIGQGSRARAPAFNAKSSPGSDSVKPILLSLMVATVLIVNSKWYYKIDI